MAWTIPIFFVLCAKIASVPLKAFSQARTLQGLLAGLTLVLGAMGLLLWRKWAVPVSISATGALLIAYGLVVWYYIFDGLDRARIERAYAEFRKTWMPMGR